MLELRDLAAARSNTVLFRRLNALLHAGEALRVAGPNGAGKTTLLRILCGLTEPARGAVCWDGTPIRALGDDYRARLGFLGHQEGHFGDLTARENLALAGLPVSAEAVLAVLAGAVRQAGEAEHHVGRDVGVHAQQLAHGGALSRRSAARCPSR